MKSINEKSFELFPEMQTDSDDQRKAFTKGANYVLDNLSMTISVSEDGHLRDNLRKMIEQLKRNNYGNN